MILGGWTRVWIVVTLLYGMLVGLVSYATRPQLMQLHDNLIQEASEVIAQTLTRIEKVDITPYDVRKNVFEKKSTADSMAWLDQVAASPTEEQKAFSSQIADLNQKHRHAVERFPRLQREHILVAFACWLGPSIFLGALGWSIGWIRRGFRARADAT